MTKSSLIRKLKDYAEMSYLQSILESEQGAFHLAKTKKGFMMKKKAILLGPPDLEHDRTKNHIIKEGTVFQSLVALGIMDEKGNIYPTKRDKFVQINRFLELLSELLVNNETEKKVIVDYGCGKAYLTFALMELMQKQNISHEMIGIDRKREVIADNQNLVNALGWNTTMSFISGNITDPLPFQKVNIVLALHACDTATDDAILQGLKYLADWIFVAPCCQHELYKQLKTPILKPLLRYGILKERVSSLLTDSIRASFLEAFGYAVDVIEFVDTEHTPKNLMIRAKRVSDSFSKEKFEKCLAWTRELGVATYLIENMEKIL